VPEPAEVRELVRRCQRRLYTYLTALLPGDDANAAVVATIERIGFERDRAPTDGFAEWGDEVARQVAAERRKTTNPLPFSDDLFRQLADSAASILANCDFRPRALEEVLHQLPPPERELIHRRYELGLTPEQIAVADARPTATVQRDLAGLHESLVSALRSTAPDSGPEPPGGAADIGRMSDHLLDGTVTDDGRLVLETLLLADAAAQTHYHRHAALFADLRWKFAGPPAIPELPVARPGGLSAREWTVTAIFILAVLAVIAFAVLRLTGPLAGF
jgi:DNA-directed RNA polymerase specialized sigma24 family protein